MILPGSRYVNATVVRVPNVNGVYVSTIFPVEITSLYTYIYHTWTGADRLDVLAYKYYDDPELYWVILDANPEIYSVTAIEVGDIIRIPNPIPISTSSAAL